MEDKQIVDLYWERSESAIAETEKKYGRYCHYIAYQILENDEDAKDIVNDTYLKTWQMGGVFGNLFRSPDVPNNGNNILSYAAR